MEMWILAFVNRWLRMIKKVNSKNSSHQTMKNVEKTALRLRKMFFISGMYHLLV